MRPVIGRTGYPLELVELEPHAEIRFGSFLISPFAVKHRVEAYGYAFVEDDRPGRFDVDTARDLGVPEGPASGACSAARPSDGVTPEQVMGETRAGRRIVISGDTAPCQAVEVFAHGADVLVHEATLMEDERDRARETGHSTAHQAAEIARDAGVQAARAHPPLHALLPARDPRRGARRVPQHGRAARLRRDHRALPGARRARAREGRARARARAGGGAMSPGWFPLDDECDAVHGHFLMALRRHALDWPPGLQPAHSGAYVLDGVLATYVDVVDDAGHVTSWRVDYDGTHVYADETRRRARHGRHPGRLRRRRIPLVPGKASRAALSVRARCYLPARPF